MIIPTVIDRDPTTGQGVAFDLFSRLMTDNIVVISGAIDKAIATVVVGQLLYLDLQNQRLPEEERSPISIYINSEGGSVADGLAILDTMRLINSQVSTICVGECCSMASVLLAAGTKGLRYALPNSRVLLHQPLGGAMGQASDIEIHANEILRVKEQLYRLLAEFTGKPIQLIEADCDRDFILNPTAAVKYGIVDRVLE